MVDPNWAPERVRRNFRLDLFSGLCSGIYLSVLVAFLPVVVRRMGGSTSEVALVVAGPFVGHLLSPFFAYLLSSFKPVRAIATTLALSRGVFVVGALVAVTPLMLALTSVTTWVIMLSTSAAYTSLMASIYPDRERAQAMGKVRMGVSISGIAAAAIAGLVIDAVPASFVFAGAGLLSLPGALSFFNIRHDGGGAAVERRPVGDIVRDVWGDTRYRRMLVAQVTYGAGNLMNFALFPILLVDHFDASNSFVGLYAAIQAATSLAAYTVTGRVIDRGSSLRITLYNNALLLLVPLGYLIAPTVWWLLPLAVVNGAVIAGGDLTFHTNLVQVAPRGRVHEYAYAQSLLLGLRGTAAPFLAATLLALFAPRGVLLIGMALMTVGTVLWSRAIQQEGALPESEVAAA
ncbi:MAG: MFS transporter [Chloroflexi bacterium]|nr:MFS transporter [Chloroflexota bacterium]